jgi:MFS superfamily sulfate permease-like transporter
MVTWSVPGLGVLRTYQSRWLAKDVVAGLVLSALLVPQGMAYAELAGLPAVTGLYTSILCLVGYPIFGPSKILVLGPDSALGPMIAATILPLIGAGGDLARAVAWPRCWRSSPVRRWCWPESASSASSLTYCRSPRCLAT